MALTTCSECSGQVSTQAAICPHCGAPATAFVRVNSVPQIDSAVESASHPQASRASDLCREEPQLSSHGNQRCREICVDKDICLPNVCATCGEPSTHREAVKFEICPRLVALFAAFISPFMSWAAFPLIEKISIQLPFCDRHRSGGTLDKRKWFLGLTGGAILILTIVPLAASSKSLLALALGIVLLGIGIGAITWAIRTDIVAHPLRATKITRRTVTIRGVSKQFAAAIQNSEAERSRPIEEFLNTLG